MSEPKPEIIAQFKEKYKIIKEELSNLPSMIDQLLEVAEKQAEENKTLQEKLQETEEKLAEMQEDYENNKTKLEELENELEKYKGDLEAVEEQMNKFRQLYEEVAQERAKELDLQELMQIYSILFEQVFAANPHTKILLLLQGTDKDTWTREEITKTTGFSAAAVLKALHDLRNNGIIELDESSNTVRLIRKIM